MIHGKDMIVKLNGVAIAASTSCELDWDCDTIEVSSPTSSTAREYITGRTGWSVATNHFVPSGSVATLKSIRGRKVSLKIYLEEEYFEGDAIVTGFKITGTKGKLAQGIFTFKGTGPLI